MKTVLAAVAVAFVILFVAAAEKPEKVELQAKHFNSYIAERNGSDERATYYDKQSVKNIIAKGCFPLIPRDTNKNITALCSDSSKK